MARSKQTKLFDTDTRISEDWWPSANLWQWALETRTDLTEQDLKWLTGSFVDHWLSVPGHDGFKSNWDATYRNWIRGCRKPARPGPTGSSRVAI